MSSQPVAGPAVAASELRHRLRTPLNHIIGYSEILREEYPAGVHTSSIESVLAEANAMVDLVQQAAAGEQTIPGSALADLRRQIEPRVGNIHRLIAAIAESMPPAAQSDLNRISAAAHVLARTLTEGFVPGSPAQPHPMDTPVETRAGALGGPGRILVVDDDEMNRDMLSRQLERQHHEVATASGGASALEMLRADRFDIVLLDLMMPGMNGFEVLSRIKSDPAFGSVAVILVSALDEMDSVVRSIEAGAEDYLFKPVNPTLLRARIKSTLEKLRAVESVQRKQRLESIGLLASGIAHDFNNLLTGIIGHAQLLGQVLAQPEDREMVESIVTAGERAAELTRQLLAYSGKAMFQMKQLDLAALIRDSEGLIHASMPRKVRLTFSLAPVPSVLADQNQVRQVLLNLALNAAEAIGTDSPGTVCISTGSEKVPPDTRFDVMPDELRPGRYAWFEVSDSGCGMDTATAAKMFEPFFTTKFLGRGLGLAAVAGIVRSHRGVLRVVTSPGHGAVLRVYFPAPESEAEESARATAAIPFVLVVDDEPVVRQIVKVALERAGRKVVLASSGEAAIAALTEHGHAVELVLLDWKMPLMDGAETLSRLRKIRPDVKVIVSSGLAQSEAEDRFREIGVTGYLQKPYRMSELVAMLEHNGTNQG